MSKRRTHKLFSAAAFASVLASGTTVMLAFASQAPNGALVTLWLIVFAICFVTDGAFGD